MKKEPFIKKAIIRVKSILYGKIMWTVENKETYKEFHNSEDASRWAEEYYGEWSREYLKRKCLVERVSISAYLCNNPIAQYCGQCYRRINMLLRNELNNTGEICIITINLLIRDLFEAPRIPSNLVLYRLVNEKFIDELIKNNKAKVTMLTQEKGFMSTNLCKNIVNSGDHYAKYNNMLKIYVDGGTVGAYVNMIAHQNEKEILLLPNMYLAMVEYPYIDIETGKTIFECKLLSDLW